MTPKTKTKGEKLYEWLTKLVEFLKNGPNNTKRKD